MNDDSKKHQSELAASGYRLPDSMYVKPAIEDQPSTEKKSGDGGKENADLGPDDSEHGYKGELTSAADASKATLKRSAEQARAARSDRETPADVGLRVATEGHLAVGASQRRTAAPGATIAQDARASSGSGSGSSSAVAFASPAAEEAAKDAGLTDADFAGQKASGEKGYTKADVDAVAASKSGQK